MVATQADDAGAAVGTNADGAASDADAGCQLTYPGQSFEGPPCADLGGGVYECRIDDNGLFDSIPLGSCHAVPNLIAPHCRAILVCDRD